MAEKKAYLEQNLDYVRTAIMLEPRGHNDMFGSIITQPCNPEADFGIIFMDGGGYLNMCGHGSIGAITAAIETGMVEKKAPVTHVVMDTPAGIVRAEAKVENNRVKEGSIVNVPPRGGRKHPDAPMVQVNTKNILFILGGAFVGLDSIIKKRLKKNTLGFNSIDKEQNLDNENILKYVTSEDLKNYGLIPEFIGRIPIITYMNQLTKDDLKRILTEPKNAIIKQYKKLFSIDNIDLIFDDDVYDYLADCAIKTNLGARSLRTITETLLSDDMYNLPKTDINELHITLDYAKEKLKIFMQAYND
jgi:hypothetical protein